MKARGNRGLFASVGELVSGPGAGREAVAGAALTPPISLIRAQDDLAFEHEAELVLGRVVVQHR